MPVNVCCPCEVSPGMKGLTPTDLTQVWYAFYCGPTGYVQKVSGTYPQMVFFCNSAGVRCLAITQDPNALQEGTPCARIIRPVR
jgi:hypothetical protein